MRKATANLHLVKASVDQVKSLVVVLTLLANTNHLFEVNTIRIKFFHNAKFPKHQKDPSRIFSILLTVRQKSFWNLFRDTLLMLFQNFRAWQASSSRKFQKQVKFSGNPKRPPLILSVLWYCETKCFWHLFVITPSMAS